MAKPECVQLADMLLQDRPGTSNTEVTELADAIQLSVDTWFDSHPTEVAPERRVCPECGGTGEVLDAPNQVLAGRSYMTPCIECNGTGHL